MVTPSPYFKLYIPDRGERVVLQSAKYQICKEVEHIKEARGAWILKFTDTAAINDALKLVSYSMYSMQAPGEDEVDDAAEVEGEYTVKDVDGCVWGKVKHIGAPGLDATNRVLEVADDKDTGHVIYIPFTGGIVKEIDHEKKIITIDPPDGLKELNKG